MALKHQRLLRWSSNSLYLQARPQLAPCTITRSIASKAWSSRDTVATATVANGDSLRVADEKADKTTVDSDRRPLARLPTSTLLRNILIGHACMMPGVLRLGLAVIDRVSRANGGLLDADRNPILRKILRLAIYDHFCGGTNVAEVQNKVAEMKRLGYSGVIACSSQEVVIDNDALGKDAASIAPVQAEAEELDVKKWLERNLETVECVSQGDYAALKFTGAGTSVVRALLQGTSPPPAFSDALDALCVAAKARGVRIWVDAEQQMYQTAIDDWTIDLMRKYNKDYVMIFNTVQCYLKASRKVIAKHLEAGNRDGFKPGFKLVRGAYIQSDIRDRIHNTKSETDASYDGIAHDLLTKSFDGIEGKAFPHVQVFLAGHNIKTIRKAAQLQKDLVLSGRNPAQLEFGQLQGMADDISCELLALKDSANNVEGLSPEQAEIRRQTAPRVFKCLNWGSVRECLHFLGRRAVENQSAAGRLKDGLDISKQELKRRLFFQ